MQRRTLLSLAALLPLPFLVRGLRPTPTVRAGSPPDMREQALELNTLATSLHSSKDARRLVDRIAEIFSDDLPPAWTTRAFRNRIAQAEFASVTDPTQGIPETRVTAVWNRYVDALAAPADTHITAGELHNQRDALFATARVFWTRPYKNIWAIPGIYATDSQGQLAPNCRVIESLRLLWDLANIPGNIKNARERNSNGILVSDLLRQAAQRPSASRSGAGARIESRVVARPVDAAARQYIQQRGVSAFNGVVQDLLSHLLS